MLKADQLRPAVVIVEHATPIRMNIVDLVDKAGCRAIETSNVEDALLLLRQLGDISGIFVDLDTPGSMGGLWFVATARTLCPTIGVIVVSGYGRPAASELPVDTVFFPKPYDAAKVVETLKRMTT